VRPNPELGYALVEANVSESEFQTQFITAGSLLYSVEHRPWLPPDSHWLFSQSWNDLLFAHFAMAPATLRSLVPEAFTLDLYDGAAWLTISPCSVSHVRPSGVPPLPGISYFSQVSLRTYVTMQGKPGLFYFSVDAANLSAVWFARIFFRIPYWHASIQMSGATLHARNPQEQTIHLRSSRLHGPKAINAPAKFDVIYSPQSEPEQARRGSLDEFLTERYCVYSWNRGRCYRAEIHHQPWKLQQSRIEIRANSMAEPFGLTLPLRPDLCHFSRSLKMMTWAPERVQLSR
jgi:hypothetical protein